MLLWLCVVIIWLVTDVVLARDSCTLQTTCDACIQTFSECAWCADKNWEEARCFSKGAFYIKKECANLMYPESSVTVTAGAPLNDIVQVYPQQLDVHLRPKMSITQTVSVRPKEGYRIDTYYLMDFSYSMKDDLANLRKLAANLTEEFRKVSEDFTIGLGTFVDKVTLPYSYTDKKRSDNPCYIAGAPTSVCEPAYSFRNEMKMSDKLVDFTSTLDSLDVSSNIDNDEGGLDALMQVVSCKDKIGFRNNSRKIVIFMTDQGSHIAGDGRLGGIFTPNDGECYTGTEVPGYYQKSLDMDYPSIEQVNRKLIENDLIPIFAVGENVVETYQEISDYLTQLSSVGRLSDDGSNLLDVVKHSLDRITTTINIVVLDAIGIKAEIEPLCNKKNGTHACTDVKYGQTVEFNITFSFEECNKDTPDKLTVPIVVTGFSTILVEITTQCTCECERKLFDDLCMNHGDLVCGVCHCHEGYYGEFCNCTVGESETKANLNKCTANTLEIITKMFRSDTVTAAQKVCSSQGRCECGQCKCRQPETPPGTARPYVEYGDVCQCNNYECTKGPNGEVCSGEGFCDCGVCNCNVTSLGVPKTNILTDGDACDCTISQKGCKHDGKVCSESGKCVCGKCQCNPKHRGKYCQICDLCGPLNCQTHIDCVLCRTLRLDTDNGETCNQFCNNPSIETDKYRVLKTDPVLYAEQSGAKLLPCGEINDNETDCVVEFYIAIMNKTTTPDSPENIDYEVLIDAVVWCDDKVNPVWMAVAIVSALLAPCMFGLVIWKLYVRHHDQQEYLKFEEMNKNAKWTTTESPIYHAAVTTYQNPIYQKIKTSASVKRGTSIKRNLSFLKRNNNNGYNTVKEK